MCLNSEVMAATRRLPPLPNTADLLRLYRIKAQKQLSQNFILSPTILDRFAKAAGEPFGKDGLLGKVTLTISQYPKSKSLNNLLIKSLLVIDTSLINSIITCVDCRGSRAGAGRNHEISLGSRGEGGARHREGRALPAVAPPLAGRDQFSTI